MGRRNIYVYVFFLLSFCYVMTRGQSDICNAAHGVSAWMGDGACDPQNLSPECQWDGGDCCRYTCVDQDFVCGIDGFFYLDFNTLDDDITTSGKIPPFASPAEVKRTWLVENSTQAQSLAEAVNTWGGTFEVEWKGSVVVNKEIVVTNGTVLIISGSEGSSAIVDGGDRTRLFRVVNASLQLSNIEVRNGNATFGGAITAIGSILTLHRTSLVGNKANVKNGGAMFVHGGSHISFREENNFLNNSSNFNGGALFIENSSVSWEGVSSFSGNRATYSGGAICAVVSSTVSWAAETSFKENHADLNSGGVLYLEGGSNASWSVHANFIDNDAGKEGGAIFIDLRSYAFWNGSTIFSGNTATSEDGGAIFIADSSTIVLNGETTFMNNSCGLQGGAVSSRALDSTPSVNSDSETSYFSIKGTTTFANNSCGSNGGAVALLSGLSMSFETNIITFLGNEAKVAGGGIFITAPSEGPTFIGASFLSNSAEVGGAVFVTGSGTSLEPSDGELSATFDRCMFIGNRADATGGAVILSTGAASLTKTTFKNNMGWLGAGALSTAGAMSLDSCNFEENLSEADDDPAIVMIGFTLEIQNCSFRRNAYDCGVNTFLNESRTGDRFAVVCNGCDYCETCKIEKPNKIPTCSEAMEHSSTPGGSHATLETLIIDEGYWRTTNDSTNLLECYNADACTGGVTGTPEFCKEGYTGPYCAVCTGKYAKVLEFTCTKCSENAWGITAAAVAAVATVIVAFFTSLHLLSPERAGEEPGITARLLRRVPIHSVKIIIVVFQILTQFNTVANVTYPATYQSFLNMVDVLNFDPTWMLSGGCIVNVNFHGRFFIMTIGPILVILGLTATYSYTARRHDISEETLEIARQEHTSALLFILFFVYSSTSSVIFKMFDCDALDDGTIYLRADYTIECDDPLHRVLMVCAGFATLLYPLGIPLFFTLLLVQKRNVLLDKAAREDDLSVKSISDLWRPYKPFRFYYEVIECVRRIVLMGATMVIEDDSAAQIAVTLMLAIVFTVMSEGLAPYELHFDAWVSRLGHAVVVFSMYFALLLKVNVSDDSQDSQAVFEIVLIVTHVLIISMVIVDMAVAGYLLKTEQAEDPSPRPKLCRSRGWRAGPRSTMSMPRIAHSTSNGDIIELSGCTKQSRSILTNSGTEDDFTVAPL